MMSKDSIRNGVEQLKEETGTDDHRTVILRKDGNRCKDSITGETWDNPEDVDADLVINITDAGGSLV